MKRIITILVVAVFSVKGVASQSHVTWKNLIDVSMVPGTVNDLKGPSNPIGAVGYATSKENVGLGCDGWFEYTVPSGSSAAPVRSVYFGVIGDHSLPVSLAKMPFCIQVIPNRQGRNAWFEVKEFGNTKAYIPLVPSFVAGDKVRIERKNGIMHFYLNGVLKDNSLTYHGEMRAQFVISRDEIVTNVMYFESTCNFTTHSDWFKELSLHSAININDNIFTNGKVGIGVLSPSESLDVNGKICSRDITLDNTLEKVLFTDDDGVLHHRLLDDILPKPDKDWLKVGGGSVTSVSDDIFTKDFVGIHNSNPNAVMDILHSCIPEPGFRIRQMAPCSYTSSLPQGDLIRVDQIDVFGGPDIAMLNFNAAGNWGLGTEANELIKAEICNLGAGLASFVSYKKPHPAGTPFNIEQGTTPQPLFQYNSIFKVDNTALSDNTIAIAVNRGDCDVLGNDVFRIYGDGTMVTTGGFNIFSDASLKQKIQTIEDPLQKIEQLNGVTYTYKQNDKLGINLPVGKQTGLIADDVAKVIPDAVQKIEEGEGEFQVVDYNKVVPLMVEAVKEQQKLYYERMKLYKQLVERKNALLAILNQETTGVD